MSNADLTQIIPPTNLEQSVRDDLFESYYRKLARFRNDRLRFSEVEESLKNSKKEKEPIDAEPEFGEELDTWSNGILKSVWSILDLQGGESISASRLDSMMILTLVH